MNATGDTVSDADGLIPKDLTPQEINEWEQENIFEAQQWAFNKYVLGRTDPLDEGYVRELHKKMFNRTWERAGIYRTRKLNIGCEHFQIRENIARLLGDVRYWLDHETYSVDEAAVRFHHRLVWQIHPFRDGNGRHARMIADVLVAKNGRPVFSWGPPNADLRDVSGAVRQAYLAALRALDANDNDVRPLLEFARS